MPLGIYDPALCLPPGIYDPAVCFPPGKNNKNNNKNNNNEYLLPNKLLLNSNSLINIKLCCEMLASS
jgi:hypothetical protein